MEDSKVDKSYSYTVPDIPARIRSALHIICDYATDTADVKLSPEEIMFAGATVTNYFLSGFPGEEVKVTNIPGTDIYFTTMETNDYQPGDTKPNLDDISEKFKASLKHGTPRFTKLMPIETKGE